MTTQITDLRHLAPSTCNLRIFTDVTPAQVGEYCEKNNLSLGYAVFPWEELHHNERKDADGRPAVVGIYYHNEKILYLVNQD